MNDLLNKKCVPCEGGVLPFDISEIHKYQKKVDGWDILKSKEKIFFLYKKFNFRNFLESQKFINEVSKISEEEGHHPDILFGWGYAEIKIYDCLDFILPQKWKYIYKVFSFIILFFRQWKI